jgi:hypothetical protein
MLTLLRRAASGTRLNILLGGSAINPQGGGHHIKVLLSPPILAFIVVAGALSVWLYALLAQAETQRNWEFFNLHCAVQQQQQQQLQQQQPYQDPNLWQQVGPGSIHSMGRWSERGEISERTYSACVHVTWWVCVVLHQGVFVLLNTTQRPGISPRLHIFTILHSPGAAVAAGVFAPHSPGLMSRPLEPNDLTISPLTLIPRRSSGRRSTRPRTCPSFSPPSPRSADTTTPPHRRRPTRAATTPMELRSGFVHRS